MPCRPAGRASVAQRPSPGARSPSGPLAGQPFSCPGPRRSGRPHVAARSARHAVREPTYGAHVVPPTSPIRFLIRPIRRVCCGETRYRGLPTTPLGFWFWPVVADPILGVNTLTGTHFRRLRICSFRTSGKGGIQGEVYLCLFGDAFERGKGGSLNENWNAPGGAQRRQAHSNFHDCGARKLAPLPRKDRSPARSPPPPPAP